MTQTTTTTTRFIATGGCSGYFTNPQPFPLDADGADFRDYGDRVLLAGLGIFSVDRTSNRNKRYGRKIRESRIEYAYHVLGIDRKMVYWSWLISL